MYRYLYRKRKLENYPLFFVNIPQVKAAGRKQKGSKTLRQEINNLGILLVVSVAALLFQVHEIKLIILCLLWHIFIIGSCNSFIYLYACLFKI